MTATRNPRRKRHTLISTAASVVLVSHRMIHVPRAMALCSSSAVRSAATSASATGARRMIRVVSVPEEQWRQRAAAHSTRVRNLLAPGLTDIDHPMNSGIRRQPGRDSGTSSADYFTALDPQNPVYNFLIEYYGLKGVKGPRRLARWSPDPSLLLCNEEELNASGLRVEEKEILHRHDANDSPILDSGIFLEGATEEDFGGTLHLKGAIPLEDGSGTIFSPSLFYNRFGGDDEGEGDSNSSSSKDKRKSAAPFQWYRAILTNTINSEPIFHCHGLHEWAMQYYPPGSDPPPSGKYQSHMPLRVSREVINEAVERRGISCTHVDALRFFAKAAAPLNHHGSQLERTDQLRLEQKGCVHAHMDLLKLSTRLQPFVDASLVADTLEISLRARQLDVEASPYDVRSFGLGVVPVESPEGRKEYRRRQKELMQAATPIRERLLTAYDAFLDLAFDDATLIGAERNPAAERFASAEPGGKPWRRSLIKEE